MNSMAKESDWSMVDSDKAVEMKSPDDAYSVMLLRGPTVQATSATSSNCGSCWRSNTRLD